MTTAINSKVMASVCSKVENYIPENMIGYMSALLVVQDIDKNT